MLIFIFPMPRVCCDCAQVTMWSPNMTTPLIKMQCHRGPVNALAVDLMGQYFATAGMDGQVKVHPLITSFVSLCFFLCITCMMADLHHLVGLFLSLSVQIWDTRTYKMMHSYYSARPASALDISQQGLLAVGYGPHIQVSWSLLALSLSITTQF
jgi:U3 small nucleolar RNA-associated protein 7